MCRSLLAALLFLALAPPARAGVNVPDPYRSTIPRRLVYCPGIDSTALFIIRDSFSHGMSGVLVTLDFSTCSSFVHCPVVHPFYQVDDAHHTISAWTDAEGYVEFRLPVGGTCPSVVVRHSLAPLFVFAKLTLVSPDQNGDLEVNSTDVAIVQAKIGSSDATADLDGDGIVTAADVAIVASHGSHHCDASTSTIHETWGRLKALYR